MSQSLQQQQQRNNNNPPNVPEALSRTLNRLLEEHEEAHSQSQTEFNERSQLVAQDSEVEEEDEDDLAVNAPLLAKIAEYNNSDSKLITLTNFKFEEMIELWEIVKSSVLNKDKRGKPGKYTPLDRFLLLLVFLKHGPTYKKFGSDYFLDKSTACRLVNKMLDLVEPELLEFFAPNETLQQATVSRKCRTHQGIKLIVDVHFQPSYKLLGRYYDSKVYFSGKHYDYGLKTETVHYPEGRCCFISKHYPGSTHDFTIFKEQANKYKTVLEKTRKEMRYVDDMPQSENFPNQWL